jgi:hypothetical protein
MDEWQLGRRALQIVLAFALALAAPVLVVQVGRAAHAARDGWNRSYRTAEQDVIRRWNVDPAVIARVASALPRDTTYELSIEPSLAQSPQGGVLQAWLRARLLPRVAVPHGSPWHVTWGLPLPRGCCRVLVDAGRVRSDAPPVFVFRHG